MKYPAIYQSTVNGNVILLFNDKQGITLDKFKATVGTSGEWDEDKFTNITAEYLANTYGEVKNKEHAEFIKLLAETNDIPCAVLSIDMNYTIFYVIDGCLFFCLKEVDVVGDYKKITIPLPPECESVDEWPKVGDEVCWSNRNHKAVVIYLCDDYAWVKELGGECLNTVHIDKLRKPKTPEEELNYELYRLCLNHCDSKFQASEIARKLMEKYSVTKKPQ